MKHTDLERVKKINTFLKGEKILDLGSDDGYLHRYLKNNNKGKQFFSCDLEKGDFKIDLDYPWKIKKNFDCIIAGEVIEHLLNLGTFLEQSKKRLKRGGRLIITTPNAIGLNYILNPSWCVFYTEYRGHSHSFTLPMLERILKDEGFKVVHSEYLNVFWMKNPLRIISKFIPRLRPDIFIVADKK